jgi:hypothetical protein
LAGGGSQTKNALKNFNKQEGCPWGTNEVLRTDLSEFPREFRFAVGLFPQFPSFPPLGCNKKLKPKKSLV